MEPDWKIDTAVCRATPPAPGFPGRVQGVSLVSISFAFSPLLRCGAACLCSAQLRVSALRIFTLSVVLASKFLLQEDSPSSAGLEEKGFVVLEKMRLVLKLLFPQQNTSFPPFETLELFSFLLPMCYGHLLQIYHLSGM